MEESAGVKKIPPPKTPEDLPYFISAAFEPIHGKLFQNVFRLLLEKGLLPSGGEGKDGAAKFLQPRELEQLMDFQLRKVGVDHKTILRLLEQVMLYSPNRSHPFYLDKMSTGLNHYSVMADFVISCMSTPALTYYFAPVFTLMGEQVKAKIRKLVGYAHARGDGIICPGGGFASVLLLRAVLHNHCPALRWKGYSEVGSPKIRVFVSEQAAHYLEKAALICGLGLDSVITIKTDTRGRMDVENLKEAIKAAKDEDYIPLMVVATAGTLALGAIDPLQEIGKICKENDIWFHVEANYAGSYIFTRDQGVDRLGGVELSDSFVWSPSEMLGLTFCTTVLVTRFQMLCEQTFGDVRDFHVLFETELYEERWDTGNASIQTSRRGSILKLWFVWRTQEIEKQVTAIDALVKTFLDKVKGRGPAFHLLLEEYDTPRIAFYYVPEGLRDKDRAQDHLNPTMKTLSRKIKTSLLKEESVHLGTSSLKGYPDFFTVSVTNPNFEAEHMTRLLDLIECYGEDKPKCTKKCLEVSKSEATSKEETHLKKLYSKFFEMLTGKGIYFQTKRAETSYNFRSPDDLIKEFDFSLDYEPLDDAGLVNILEKVIFYSLHQAHPYDIHQLVSNGIDAYSLIGDFVSGMYTSPMISYEDSPVYTLMEREVFAESRKLINYPADGDGIICPGGSISIITAIYVARHAKFPETHKTGITGEFTKRLVCFLSESAHYSFRKGCILQGIGIENFVNVPLDKIGRMSVPALRKAIEKTLAEGGTPYLVEATAGTTPVGAFDPIDEIADVCEEFGLWLHVDGSVGGSIIFSDKQRSLRLKGLERSDSFNYNPHKMLGAVAESSVLLFKQRGIIREAFGTRSPNPLMSHLLYDQAEFDNPGQGGFQVDRRPQILKFWLMWKAKGQNGLGQHVDRIHDLTAFATEELHRRKESFQIWFPEFDTTNVLFLYVPKKLRGLERGSPEYLKRVAKVADKLFIKLLLDGIMQIGVEPDRDSPPLLKFVFFNSALTKDDVVYLLDQVDNYGQDLDV